MAEKGALSMDSLAQSDQTGLEPRYRVEKINDPVGKHDDCRYFVLDPEHDQAARFALRAYMVAAENAGQWSLARDLREWLNDLSKEAHRG